VLAQQRIKPASQIPRTAAKAASFQFQLRPTRCKTGAVKGDVDFRMSSPRPLCPACFRRSFGVGRHTCDQFGSLLSVNNEQTPVSSFFCAVRRCQRVKHQRVFQPLEFVNGDHFYLARHRFPGAGSVFSSSSSKKKTVKWSTSCCSPSSCKGCLACSSSQCGRMWYRVRRRRACQQPRYRKIHQETRSM